MTKSAYAFLALTLLIAGPVAAQDSAWTWENATELSFVSTGGSASSSTFGLKASLTGIEGPNTFKLDMGGIRTEGIG